MKTLFVFSTGLLTGVILTSTTFCGLAVKNGKSKQYYESLLG